MGAGCSTEDSFNDLIDEANMLLQSGQYDEANEACDEALRLKQDDANVHYLKAMALEGMQKKQEAMASYDKSIELDPEFKMAHLNKGMALYTMGKYEEAVRCFEEAIRIDSQDKNAYNLKGVSLHQLGKYDEAIGSYDKALEIDPEYEAALANKEATEEQLDALEEDEEVSTLDSHTRPPTQGDDNSSQASGSTASSTARSQSSKKQADDERSTLSSRRERYRRRKGNHHQPRQPSASSDRSGSARSSARSYKRREDNSKRRGKDCLKKKKNDSSLADTEGKFPSSKDVGKRENKSSGESKQAGKAGKGNEKSSRPKKDDELENEPKDEVRDSHRKGNEETRKFRTDGKGTAYSDHESEQEKKSPRKKSKSEPEETTKISSRDNDTEGLSSPESDEDQRGLRKKVKEGTAKSKEKYALDDCDSVGGQSDNGADTEGNKEGHNHTVSNTPNRGNTERGINSSSQALHTFSSAGEATEIDANFLPGTPEGTTSNTSPSHSHCSSSKTVLKLYKAARNGDLKTIKEIAIDSRSLRLKDSAGNTFLHKLLKSGDFETDDLVESLLEDPELEFDLNIQDSKGRTLLHVALEKANIELADTLMSLGADPNIRDFNGKSVLSYLVQGKHFDEYQYFYRQYEEMFDKQICSSEDLPHVGSAACTTRFRQKSPLESRSSQMINTYSPNNQDDHRVGSALFRNSFEKSTKSASPSGQCSDAKKVLKLHKAAKHGDIASVKGMAKDFGCLDVRDSAGNTFMHKLIKSDEPEDHEIAEYLLQEEDLDFDVNMQDSKGKTLLHVALERIDVNLADSLMSLGANPNIKDYSGKSALAYLIEARYFDEYRYFYRQYEDAFDQDVLHGNKTSPNAIKSEDSIDARAHKASLNGTSGMHEGHGTTLDSQAAAEADVSTNSPPHLLATQIEQVEDLVGNTSITNQTNNTSSSQNADVATSTKGDSNVGPSRAWESPNEYDQAPRRRSWYSNEGLLPSTADMLSEYGMKSSSPIGQHFASKTVLKLYKLAKLQDREAIKEMSTETSLDVTDATGNTFLHKLIKSGDSDDHAIAESLLSDPDLNFDVNVQDSKGRTLLHLALEKPNIQLADTLMSLGADPNIKDTDGKTVLTYLVEGKHFHEYRYFYRQYEDVVRQNSRDSGQRSGIGDKHLSKML